MLFWLSLIPFATAWMGEKHFAPWPVALYGAVLFCAGLAYYVLVRVLIARHGPASLLARAIGRDTKGWLSMVIYAVGIGLAFVSAGLAMLVYAAVAVMWLIPDMRIEKTLGANDAAR